MAIKKYIKALIHNSAAQSSLSLTALFMPMKPLCCYWLFWPHRFSINRARAWTNNFLLLDGEERSQSPQHRPPSHNAINPTPEDPVSIFSRSQLLDIWHLQHFARSNLDIRDFSKRSDPSWFPQQEGKGRSAIVCSCDSRVQSKLCDCRAMLIIMRASHIHAHTPKHTHTHAHTYTHAVSVQVI